MPAHDSWVDESGLHAPELLANYKQQLVRQVLINLAQSATTEITQPAQIPHDQSALLKCWEPTHIRTLQVGDEKASLTSFHAGAPTIKEIQSQEIPSSLPHTRVLSCRPPVSPSIHYPQVPQVQAWSLDTHHSHPHPSTPVVLQGEVLHVPSIESQPPQDTGFPLPVLHPLPTNPYSLLSQYRTHRTSLEVQHCQLLPTLKHMNNESPSRDDSASPSLAYPRA